MSRTKDKEPAANQKRSALRVFGILAIIGLVVLLFNRGAPPQMGADKEAFKIVDALFTAVTARDEHRIGKCAAHLEELTSKEKLPSQAGEYLDNVIAMTRDGHWQPAAERLYVFMKAQRREQSR